MASVCQKVDPHWTESASLPRPLPVPGGVAAPPLPGRALGSADSGRAEGSGRSRQAARAAAPGLTRRGAGTHLPWVTGATAARAQKKKKKKKKR